MIARIALGILLLMLLVMFIKNDVTFRRRQLIHEAIYKYSLHMIEQRMFFERKVDFCDMECYENTLFRFWDWGYTRILPPEKFEIIKPYIK